MWQRFTERARKVVFYAQEEAQKFGEGYVSTEHLLLGLLRESGSVASRVLDRLGVSESRIRAEVEKQLPRGDARPSQDMTLTPRAKRVIDLAYDEARKLNNNYIGTEHILLGLIREGDGLAGRALDKCGVRLKDARNAVMELQEKEHEERETGKTNPLLSAATFLSRLIRHSREEQPIDAGTLMNMQFGRFVPELMLLGLASDETGEGFRILNGLNVPVADLHALMQITLMTPVHIQDDSCRQVTFEQLISSAGSIANELGQAPSSAHVLLAVFRVESSPAAKALRDAGVTEEALIAAVRPT